MTPDAQAQAELAVLQLLDAIGEDWTRDGLRGTPARVARFWKEWMSWDPGTLDTLFDGQESYDEMVTLRGIRGWSICEHHLLPFSFTATVGYIPDAKLLGLSKLARIVQKVAHRLQLQERMAVEIADELERLTGAKGVGVVIEGVHTCAAMRGIRQDGASFVTTVVRGALRERPEARAEFLRGADR